MNSTLYSARLAPLPAVSFTSVLKEQNQEQSVIRSGLGIMLAMLAYVILLSAIPNAFSWVGWRLRNSSVSFQEFRDDAISFKYLEGMVGTHLAIASMIVVCLVIVRLVHKRQMKWLVSVQPGMRWRFCLVAIFISVFTLNAIYWISRIGKPFDLDPQPGYIWWLILILITAPLQAAGEEFLFRGYLMQAAGTISKSPWIAVSISALVFALLHGTQNLALFVDRFGFGLLAGTLVVLTGGLEASIAAHLVNNVFAFGYATLEGGLMAARTMQSSTWATTLWDLAAYAIAFAFIWLAGRRMNLAFTTPNN